MEEKHHQSEKRVARARQRTPRSIAIKQSSKRLRKISTSAVRACDLTRARAIGVECAQCASCSYCVFSSYCADRRNDSVIAARDDFADVLIELICDVH